MQRSQLYIKHEVDVAMDKGDQRPYRFCVTLRQIRPLLLDSSFRLSVLNRILHMLDKRTRLAYFNGLILPHLDYADTVWGDQPGLKSEMQQLQAFQNRFTTKIAGGNLSSAEALTLLKWLQ